MTKKSFAERKKAFERFTGRGGKKKSSVKASTSGGNKGGGNKNSNKKINPPSREEIDRRVEEASNLKETEVSTSSGARDLFDKATAFRENVKDREDTPLDPTKIDNTPTADEISKALKDAAFYGFLTKTLTGKDLAYADVLKRAGIDPKGLRTASLDRNTLNDYIMGGLQKNYASQRPGAPGGLNVEGQFERNPDGTIKDLRSSFASPSLDDSALGGFMKYSTPVGIMNFLAGGSGDYGSMKTYAKEVLGLSDDQASNYALTAVNSPEFFRSFDSDPLLKAQTALQQPGLGILDTVFGTENRNQPSNPCQPGYELVDGVCQPIAGSGEGGDGATDPGTDPTYTPPPQNYFTFFDPDMGKYRSGTYDEYLRYVTAKDGGIIQLQEGGTPPNAPGGVLPQGRKEQLEDLFKARREIQNLDTPTDSERKGSSMIMAEIDDRAKDISDISKEGIMMAMRDQPAKDLFAANNPDIGPALREDLSFPKKIGDSAMSLFMEAVRKNDITQGSANQFLEEALNNFVAAGIIPPNTSYDQLTDPFKDLVTREAAMIANSENMRAQEIGMQGPTIDPQTAPYIMQEGKPEDLQQMKPFMFGPTPDYTDRPLTGINTPDIRMYEVADGGIIGLKDGGMNDMMEADSLMFKDPSDEGEWEYNV